MYIVGADDDYVANRNVWIRRDDVDVMSAKGRAFSHACFFSHGVAPIHRAAEEGRSSTLEFLIARKADLSARDK